MITLFFDAGGTLLRPRDPVGQTYAEVALRFGAELDAVALDQGFRSAFRLLKHRPVGSIPRNGDDRAWWKEVVGMAMGDQPRPDDFPFEPFFETLYLTYEDPHRWVLYPEVEETLEVLHQRGCRMAIISNWDSRLRKILQGHFLTAFFNEIFISSELGLAKPSPSLYQRALQTMGCLPHEAWMIGDDLVNDQEIPLQLGWRSLLLNRPVIDLRKSLDILI